MVATMEMTTHSVVFSASAYVYDEFSDSYPDEDESPAVGALSVLYYFMFVFSVCTNTLVLVIICRFERLSAVPTVLLLNLVVSSLVFMSSLPLWGMYLQLGDWVLGDWVCKAMVSLYYLGLYSSILFLTLLTFDRHLAVVYALSVSRLRGRSYVAVSCTMVWTISALACVKPVVVHSSFFYRGRRFCQEYPGPRTDVDVELLRTCGFYIQLFLFLLVPVAVVMFCYVSIALTLLHSRIASRLRTLRLILLIVLLFLLCWVPFNIAVLMHDKAAPQDRHRWHQVLDITRYFAYFYCCISPIFYTFVGKKFQNYFRVLLVQRFPKLTRYVSVSPVPRTNVSPMTSNPNDL